MKRPSPCLPNPAQPVSYLRLALDDHCICAVCESVRHQERRLARLTAMAGRVGKTGKVGEKGRARLWRLIRRVKLRRDEAERLALARHRWRNHG